MDSTFNAAEIFLVQIDPARALERSIEDLERLAKLDPKLGAAKTMLQEQFRLLPPDSLEVLGAALWTYSRRRSKRHDIEGLRAWFDDGSRVLRAVEGALGGIFSVPVLNEVIRHCTAMVSTDSALPSTEFQLARAEIQRFLSTDSLPVLSFLAGAGAYSLYMMYVEGHTLQPPHPPPPPPPPNSFPNDR